jgi:hypothetical protein
MNAENPERPTDSSKWKCETSSGFSLFICMHQYLTNEINKERWQWCILRDNFAVIIFYYILVCALTVTPQLFIGVFNGFIPVALHASTHMGHLQVLHTYSVD